MIVPNDAFRCIEALDYILDVIVDSDVICAPLETEDEQYERELLPF